MSIDALLPTPLSRNMAHISLVQMPEHMNCVLWDNGQQITHKGLIIDKWIGGSNIHLCDIYIGNGI